jgi:hypothetical protein
MARAQRLQPTVTLHIVHGPISPAQQEVWDTLWVKLWALAEADRQGIAGTTSLTAGSTDKDARQFNSQGLDRSELSGRQEAGEAGQCQP